MNEVLKVFLSMSFSGSLLILALLLAKSLLKNKISRQWQYYIWLAAVFRLLLPFGPETSLLGRTYQTAGQAINQTAILQRRSPLDVPNASAAAEHLTAARPRQDIVSLSKNYIWLIWLAGALGLLIRKVTIYQGFTRYIRAGSTPVSDIEILDRLSIAAEQAGVKKPVELCIHPLISSPLLTGFFRPRIALPSADVSERDFAYIVLHELTHYKRRDMFYKWLVQITICLHWFNPIVHLMGREITKACEFSCDEAVLAKIKSDNARAYGKTLLNAMAAVRKYRENLGGVTLSENKKLLKERITAIMNFKKRTKTTWLITVALTLFIITSAIYVGVYNASAAPNQTPGKPQVSRSESDSTQANRYYEVGSLPLFQLVFSRLNEKEQLAWLEKLYAADDFAFFSVAVNALREDSPLLAGFAERAYTDEEIAFFSVLTNRMDKTELERWLDRALEDDRWSFQSMLFDRLDLNDEKDAQEKEWAARQKAEYQTVGVTCNGKNYYYQGQLVNIFLDMRRNQSVYTLNLNPSGSVNIKIIRGEDDRITGAAYMTEAEAAELLGDMDDPDDDLEG